MPPSGNISKSALLIFTSLRVILSVEHGVCWIPAACILNWAGLLILNKIISDFPRLIDGKKHEFDAANTGTASRAV